MLKVALTGGMAAGKSTAAARLRQAGLPVIDADRLARAAVAPGTDGLGAVAAEFGRGVILPDGSLDRAALGRVVFADPAARHRLEGIVHPLVQAHTAALLQAAADAGEPVVVYDIPLLVETGQADDFDLVVTVSAPEALRIGRAGARGLTPDQARARVAAQATDAQREAAADIVLDGSGTAAGLEAQVDAILVPALRAHGASGPDLG